MIPTRDLELPGSYISMEREKRRARAIDADQPRFSVFPEPLALASVYSSHALAFIVS